jgi:hypothetical protein
LHQLLSGCLHTGTDHHPDKGPIELLSGEEGLAMEPEDIVRLDVGLDLAEIRLAIRGEQVKLDVGRNPKDLSLGILEDEALRASQGFTSEFLNHPAYEILKTIAKPS